MAEKLADLVIKILGQKDPSLNNVLDATEKAVNQKMGKIKDLAKQGAVAFGGFTLTVGMMGKSMIDAASKYEQYRATLLTVTKSQEETNRIFRETEKFATTTPFELQEVMKSTVLIKAMGLELNRTRTNAGNLAAAFQSVGMTLDSATNGITKAMVGNAEGYEILRNQAGITKEELVKFGGVLDTNGNLMLKNKEAVDKNREALMKLIETRYSTAMKNQMATTAGVMSNLSDEFDKFKAGIGEALILTVKELTQKLIEWTKVLNNLSDQQKQGIAEAIKWGIGIGVVGTSLSVVVRGLIEFRQAWLVIEGLKIVESIKGIDLSLQHLSGTMGANIALIGSSAAAILVSILHIKESLDEEDRLKKMQKENLENLKIYYELKQNGIIKETDLYKALIVAREKGDKKTLQRLRELIKGSDEWAAKMELNGAKVTRSLEESYQAFRRNNLEMRAMAEGKTYAQVLAEEEAAIKKTQQESGGMVSAENEVLLKDKLTDVFLPTGKDYDLTKSYTADIVDEMTEAADEFEQNNKERAEKSAKAEEDARKKKLQNALNYLDLLKTQNKISADEEIKYLNTILNTYELTEEEKKGILKDRYRLETKLRQDAQKKEEDARKNAAEKLKNYNEEIKNEILRLTLTSAQMEVFQFNTKLEEYRKAGVSEVEIKRLIEAKKQEMSKETTEKEKESIQEEKNAYDDLLSKLKQLQSARGNSPMKSLEEVGLESSLLFAKTNRQVTLPDKTSPSALMSQLGKSPGAMFPDGRGGTTVDNSNSNNITINGITIQNPEAVRAVKTLVSLVNPRGYNRSESME